MTNLTDKHMSILKHSLGIECLAWYEREKIENPYRNYFCTNESTVDYPLICDLVQEGLMTGPFERFGNTYFVVTEKGTEIAKNLAREYALKNKPTRSKRRYLAYLHSESGESFFEWLKNHYWDEYRKRFGA